MAGTEGREPEGVGPATLHCFSNDPFISRWVRVPHPWQMARHVLIAALAGVMLASFPAFAQDAEPQLDGAPPPLQIPKPTPPKPVPPKSTPKPAPPAVKIVTPKVAAPAPVDTAKAEQARLAQQAAAQKTEQARLTSLAASLEVQQARLDARAAEITAGEKRLAREREDQDADYARKLAELGTPRETPRPTEPTTASLPPAPTPPTAPARIRVSYDDARTACTRAGMSDAIDHDFFSARYDAAPRFYERQRELRGRMRMDDREGYLTVDTVCQLDANGAVLRFEVLR